MLQLVLHHTMTDGWSTGIICKELSASYNAFTIGQHPQPLPLPVQYADYGGWQRDWLKKHVMSNQVSFGLESIKRAAGPAAACSVAVQSYV